MPGSVSQKKKVQLSGTPPLSSQKKKEKKKKRFVISFFFTFNKLIIWHLSWKDKRRFEYSVTWFSHTQAHLHWSNIYARWLAVKSANLSPKPRDVWFRNLNSITQKSFKACSLSLTLISTIRLRTAAPHKYPLIFHLKSPIATAFGDWEWWVLASAVNVQRPALHLLISRNLKLPRTLPSPATGKINKS